MNCLLCMCSLLISPLALLHSEQPKLYGVLAVLSAIRLRIMDTPQWFGKN